MATFIQDIHQAVDHFASIDCPLVATLLGRSNLRGNKRLVVVRQITRVTQRAVAVATAVLIRQHRQPQKQTASLGSQVIEWNQVDPGQRLRPTAMVDPACRDVGAVTAGEGV